MIKKLLISSFITILASTTLFGQSENYKMIKVDLGGLLAFPSGDFDFGAGFYIEPKFNLTDNISLGIRYESAFLAYVSPFNNEVLATTLGSWALTGDYYLGTSSFRPFAGFVIGTYKFRSVDAGNAYTFESGSKIGFAPRIGFEAGHFRLAMAYNLVPDANYLAIKAGVVFGGGMK